MEQVIKCIFPSEPFRLEKEIQKITSEMNQKDFKLTALSCMSCGTVTSQIAYLVFTKE